MRSPIQRSAHRTSRKITGLAKSAVSGAKSSWGTKAQGVSPMSVKPPTRSTRMSSITMPKPRKSKFGKAPKGTVTTTKPTSAHREHSFVGKRGTAVHVSGSSSGTRNVTACKKGLGGDTNCKTTQRGLKNWSGGQRDIGRMSIKNTGTDAGSLGKAKTSIGSANHSTIVRSGMMSSKQAFKARQSGKNPYVKA